MFKWFHNKYFNDRHVFFWFSLRSEADQGSTRSVGTYDCEYLMGTQTQTWILWKNPC